MEHMAREHSFFIPDIEYLVNLPGLLAYLGEKVSIANVCLYCNGKGKGFHSLDAIRDHMISKGHTKLMYDEDDADLEYAEFYDFTQGEEDWEDLSDNDDMDEDVDIVIEEDDDVSITAKKCVKEPFFFWKS